MFMQVIAFCLFKTDCGFVSFGVMMFGMYVESIEYIFLRYPIKFGFNTYLECIGLEDWVA